ncbi:hypothetical protein LCGC14_1202400, partial [marine sediment metagenome]
MVEVARSPQLHNPLPDQCVLYLPLFHNEFVGSLFSSADDFRHVCTVTGATKIREGFSLDGTDDHISVADAPSLSALSALTVLVWRWSDTFKTNKAIIGKYFHSSDREWIFKTGGDEGAAAGLEFQVYDQSEGANVGRNDGGGSNLDDGAWHLVGATYN